MPPIDEKKGRLATLRLIWATLVIGQIAFAAVAMLVIAPGHNFKPNPQGAQVLTIVGVIMMLVILPLAFVIRRMVYAPGPDGQIQYGKYAAGNIIFYAMCESVAFVGIFALLMKGTVGEQILIPAIAVALQIVNYPTGLPQLK